MKSTIQAKWISKCIYTVNVQSFAWSSFNSKADKCGICRVWYSLKSVLCSLSYTITYSSVTICHGAVTEERSYSTTRAIQRASVKYWGLVWTLNTKHQTACWWRFFHVLLKVDFWVLWPKLPSRQSIKRTARRSFNREISAPTIIKAK